ncbi:RraA family protein [Paracoccus laeviglucosivorans]|uniref:Putative 4-hydroxy-4-methyl-2-oxoglutarate aldolase n=1 Tax=Paracoccus laeviglucosivorans TaxID=1197861 RepID=A0A521EN73_9RHOB|nr:RraA family protein [Paracoccus laeviglucosivorans]SMO85342.1 RraA famliy [Paracoccus laeviglucosivorans]
MANTGFRIFTRINRPAPELIDAFRDVPVANIGDSMNRASMLDARIRRISKVNLAGPAFTVKSRAGDNLMLHKALDMAQPGDVIVFDGHGDLTSAITGELMMQIAIERKLGGVVIDGAIRDLGTLRDLDLPIFAAGVTPAGPYKDGPGEINVPVSVGSVVVNPGDIVVGDEDGIVIIPPAQAQGILAKAQKKQADEGAKMAAIRGGTNDVSWVDRELAAKGCEIIDDFWK